MKRFDLNSHEGEVGMEESLDGEYVEYTEAIGIADKQAQALRDIADVMWASHKLEQAKFDKLYPTRPQPQDVTLTRVPTLEDRIKQDQGAGTGETIAEWLTLREGYWASQKESAEPGIPDSGAGPASGDSPAGGEGEN